jgi:hypothetical protein
VRLPKTLDILQIILKQWIELDVCAKARPIVSVNELLIWAVNDVNIPAHQAHLQTQDSRVATIIRKNEFDGIAVRNPNKLLPEDIMPDFVDTIITYKAFTQMKVQPYFVAAAFPSSEANWVEDRLRFLGHESESFSVPIVL